MSNITRVYVADITPLEDDNLFSARYEELPEYRRCKVDRIKLQKDKIRGVAAGILLQYAYEDYIANTNICDELACIDKITTGENGKPYFENSKVFYNLSHSGDRVMCALSIDEVGCDVEYKSKNSEKIAKRFFAVEEVDYITSAMENAAGAFTKIWTLKESVLKASGCGLSFPMNEFSVVENGNIAEKISFKRDNQIYYLFNFNGENGYEYSLACKHSNVEGIFNIII